MVSNFYTELLGDCFVHSLQVDFITKKTILILGGHPDNNKTEKHVVTFINVVWQDLNHIQEHNIFFGMEVSDNFNDFKNREKEYLSKMKNYFEPGVLYNIEKDKTLKYYFIIPTAGLSGFIICKDAKLATTHSAP